MVGAIEALDRSLVGRRSSWKPSFTRLPFRANDPCGIKRKISIRGLTLADICVSLKAVQMRRCDGASTSGSTHLKHPAIHHCLLLFTWARISSYIKNTLALCSHIGSPQRGIVRPSSCPLLLHRPPRPRRPCLPLLTAGPLCKGLCPKHNTSAPPPHRVPARSIIVLLHLLKFKNWARGS